MKKFNKNIDPEALRFEIELKKARLNLKTGMQFENNPDNELPPEIESAFLDSVERFEDAWQNAKRIKVFDKLDQPVFRKSDTLSEREVSEELKKVKGLLIEKDLYVDTICPVDDRTLYIFITEELMEHEMDDLNIPDMMVGFTYEEFHPNHEHDIKEVVSRLVRDLFKHDDFVFSRAPKSVVNFQELQQFCNAFEELTIHHFNTDNVLVSDDQAYVIFQIKFTGNIDRSSGSVLFGGQGSAKLELDGDFWNVVRLELPV